MRGQGAARRWAGGVIAILVVCVASSPGTPFQTPSAAAQTSPRTFVGTFDGSGTFSNSLCAWRTIYDGMVYLTLTFGATGVTGTARHQGYYTDELTNGPIECGGDLNTFDVTAPVSGSAQALSWGFAHGTAGRVAVTASLVGNAIVGRGITTDPEYAGSATIPFTATEVGGAPPAPTATASPTAVATPVPTVAPTAVAPTATTSPAAGASPSGTPDASAPGGVAPPLPTVPPVPPPSDATTTTPTIDRDDCQNFSSDPAMWKALEEHLDELDQESVPVTAVRTCLELYRSQPWPQGTDGYTLATPEGENAEAAPKATLQTETALVLKATELGRSVTVQGAVLGKGDTLVTRDQGATVEYSEGTRLEMGPKSAIVMGDPAEKTVVQLRGRLFMDIKSRQWHVRIPQPRGLVAVVTRGTVLTTEARDDGMVWIEVPEGSVDVTSAGQTVTVSAGSSIVVDPGAAPPAPAPSATAETSGGTQVAVYGVVAAVGVIAVAGAVFLMRRRSTSRT